MATLLFVNDSEGARLFIALLQRRSDMRRNPAGLQLWERWS